MLLKTRKFIKDEFLSWNWFEGILILVSTTLMLISSTVFQADAKWWETTVNVFAGFTGIVGVILGAKGKISAFFVATINSILYITIALATQMYSSSILHLVFYIPMNIVGFALWFKKRDQKGDVLPKKLSLYGFITVILITLTVWAIYFPTLWTLTPSINNKASFVIDSIILIATILAIFLMVFRYAEQWYFWLLTNTLNLIIWVVNLAFDIKQNHSMTKEVSQDIVMIITFAASFTNSVYGFIRWFRMKEDEEIFIINKVSDDEYQKLPMKKKINYKLNLFFTKKPQNKDMNKRRT